MPRQTGPALHARTDLPDGNRRGGRSYGEIRSLRIKAPEGVTSIVAQPRSKIAKNGFSGMDEHQSQLAEQGFAILPGYMSAAMLASMSARVDELFDEEGEHAGSEFRREENARRLANLVDKGEVFRDAISRPEILTLVESVLGPEF